MLISNIQIVNFIKVCHRNEYNFFLITDMKRIRGNLWEYGRQAPSYVIHIYDAHLILHRFIYSHIFMLMLHSDREFYCIHKIHDYKKQMSQNQVRDFPAFSYTIYTYSTEHTQY